MRKEKEKTESTYQEQQSHLEVSALLHDTGFHHDLDPGAAQGAVSLCLM